MVWWCGVVESTAVVLVWGFLERCLLFLPFDWNQIKVEIEMRRLSNGCKSGQH